MVEEIKIYNFKSIKNQNVQLGKLNVLVGQNGAGKSNFISLFRFLERLSDQQLSDYIFQSGGIDSFLFGGMQTSNNIQIVLHLGVYPEVVHLYRFRIIGSAEDYKFTGEEMGYWEKRFPAPLDYPIPNDSKESKLKQQKNANEWHIKTTAKNVYDYIKDLKVFHFHDTSENAGVKLLQPIDDVYFLQNEADNIAPFLNYLKEKDNSTYFKIVETIKLVYPRFHDFRLDESPNAKGKMQLRWTEKGSEHVYNARQMSDGTLRFICLATLLQLPPNSKAIPKTIILDEPELGLHPFAIHILAELIRKASLERQLILATQSVTLINHFQPEDLLIAERESDGQTTFHRKSNEELAQWLEDYTLGQLWENNFIGGRP